MLVRRWRGLTGRKANGNDAAGGRRKARRLLRPLLVVDAVIILAGALWLGPLFRKVVITGQSAGVYGLRFHDVLVRSSRAIASHRPALQLRTRRTIRVFDLGPGACAGPPTISGVDLAGVGSVASVDLFSQALFSDSPAGLYGMEVYGDGNGSLGVAINGKAVPLAVDADDPNSADSVPAKWFLRLFHRRAPKDDVVPLAETWIGPQNAGEAGSRWVSLEPIPVFERTLFISGSWFGTYACWSRDGAPQAVRCEMWTAQGRIDRTVDAPSMN
jgi:hypothetical protein